MKVVKIIFGILASVYALAQLATLVRGISTHRIDFHSPYATGQVIGSLTAIIVGILIAVVCFKKKTEKKA